LKFSDEDYQVKRARKKLADSREKERKNRKKKGKSKNNRERERILRLRQTGLVFTRLFPF